MLWAFWGGLFSHHPLKQLRSFMPLDFDKNICSKCFKPQFTTWLSFHPFISFQSSIPSIHQGTAAVHTTFNGVTASRVAKMAERQTPCANEAQDTRPKGNASEANIRVCFEGGFSDLFLFFRECKLYSSTRYECTWCGNRICFIPRAFLSSAAAHLWFVRRMPPSLEHPEQHP